jgi:hypothetical protein
VVKVMVRMVGAFRCVWFEDMIGCFCKSIIFSKYKLRFTKKKNICFLYRSYKKKSIIAKSETNTEEDQIHPRAYHVHIFMTLKFLQK